MIVEEPHHERMRIRIRLVHLRQLHECRPVNVGRARVLERDGDRVTLESRLPLLRVRQRVDVHVRDGWCLMQGRGFVAGMAVRPEGERTRFAHLEAARGPGASITRPLMKVKMVLTRELQRIEKLARDRQPR